MRSLITPTVKASGHSTRVRGVLLWVLLALFTALVSPVLRAQSGTLVCTSTGGMKLVLDGQADNQNPDNADAPQPMHCMDCGLCAAMSAPYSTPRVLQTKSSALAHALRPLVAAHLSLVSAPPLPSRGPPAFPV